jgi:hypothetical protein
MTGTQRTQRMSTGAQTPHIREMASQHLAVVETVGEPGAVGPAAIQALYGTVYALKFALKKEGRDFKVGALRSRWPDADLAVPWAWHGLWALPIPDEVEALASKDPQVPVRVEDWEYGTVAEIVHLGPYVDEPATLERLRAFIVAQGYEIAGPHEEEYRSRPGAKVQQTILRCRVRPAVD